jgi:hypothetical protein
VLFGPLILVDLVLAALADRASRSPDPGLSIGESSAIGGRLKTSRDVADRYETLVRRIGFLEAEVDRAYEQGDPDAERLDIQLLSARDELEWLSLALLEEGGEDALETSLDEYLVRWLRVVRNDPLRLDSLPEQMDSLASQLRTEFDLQVTPEQAWDLAQQAHNRRAFLLHKYKTKPARRTLQNLLTPDLAMASASDAASLFPRVLEHVEELAGHLADEYVAWCSERGGSRFEPPDGVGRRLGSGETRIVYEIEGFAVKIPREPGWAEMNRVEATAWHVAPPKVRKFLLPVLAHHPYGHWLIMPIAERVEPVSEREAFCRRVLSELGDNVLNDVWHGNVGRWNGRLVLFDYADDIEYAIREGLLDPKR